MCLTSRQDLCSVGGGAAQREKNECLNGDTKERNCLECRSRSRWRKGIFKEQPVLFYWVAQAPALLTQGTTCFQWPIVEDLGGGGAGGDCANVVLCPVCPGPWATLVSYVDWRLKSGLFIDKQSQVCEQEMILFKTLEKRSEPTRIQLTGDTR